MRSLVARLGWLPASLALVLVAAACSSASSTSTSPAGVPSSVASTSGDVAVALNQWSVVPGTTTIPAGKVTFAVANEGTITHEFVVLQTDTSSADIPIKSFEGEADRINEDTAGTNVGETGDMEAGTSQTLTLHLQPGHYVFLCNLPDHYAQGMHIDISVQ